MLTIGQEQLDHMARGMIIRKLVAAFLRDFPNFAELVDADRTEFMNQCVTAAQAKGLKTEQGIASYALAVWWLGLGFEGTSEELAALLKSDYPEVRKVHAMNEWVRAVIGHPDDIVAADEKIKQALEVTRAWGE
jgi:hypothetical protein